MATGSTGNLGIQGTLVQGLQNFAPKTHQMLEENMEWLARDMVAYAKGNAPWDDRTGDARAGIGAEVDGNQSAIWIDMYHSVDYGIWLEVRWGGRYAIIIPTMEKFEPELFGHVEGRISNIVYYA